MSGQTVEFFVVLLTGGGLGGLFAEVLRHRRGRVAQRLERHTIGTDDFKVFEAVWRAEMKRLHEEVNELRLTVVRLSVDLERLGGDPLAIRAAVRRDQADDEPPESGLRS